MPANKRRARTSAAVVKPNPTVLAANNLKSAVALGTVIAQNGSNGPTTLTLKEQQQLDRNAYLSALTKEQLKVECRKRGQKNTGNKAELVQTNTNFCANSFLFPFSFVTFVLFFYYTIYLR